MIVGLQEMAGVEIYKSIRSKNIAVKIDEVGDEARFLELRYLSLGGKGLNIVEVPKAFVDRKYKKDIFYDVRTALSLFRAYANLLGCCNASIKALQKFMPNITNEEINSIRQVYLKRVLRKHPKDYRGYYGKAKS